MLRVKCVVLILVALGVSEAVKVNMQGSLALGQEVMDVLADYVKENILDRRIKSGRRKVSDSADVLSVVKSEHVCRDLLFCIGKTEKNINEYVVSLHRAVSDVFEGILQEETFAMKPKLYLRDVKKILKRASSQVTEENEVHTWTSVLKKIASSFLERATEFLADRLDTNQANKNKVLSILMQQLVLAIARTEREYQMQFCVEHNICVVRMGCTRALNDVLAPMKTMDESKLRSFIEVLHEHVTESPVMLRLDASTRRRFERILYDMAHSDLAPTREILMSVKKTVEDRLKDTPPKGNDVILINSILSDVDHVFDQQKFPFETFLSQYDEWVKRGGALAVGIKQIIKDLTIRLSEQSSVFTFKLMNEVKVFLELTIDSADKS